jgi:hypothetical protein
MGNQEKTSLVVRELAFWGIISKDYFHDSGTLATDFNINSHNPLWAQAIVCVFLEERSWFFTSPKLGMTKSARHPRQQPYTCPMHPEVIQDHPGDCPKWAMLL